jgi:hypothetical protein
MGKRHALCPTHFPCPEHMATGVLPSKRIRIDEMEFAYARLGKLVREIAAEGAATDQNDRLAFKGMAGASAGMDLFMRAEARAKTQNGSGLQLYRRDGSLIRFRFGRSDARTRDQAAGSTDDSPSPFWSAPTRATPQTAVRRPVSHHAAFQAKTANAAYDR